MNRKRTHDSDNDPEDASMSGNESSSSKDSDSSSQKEGEVVDVDFEFFDPKPIDFHAMKRMLIGSFGDDAEDFNISALVDLILEQNTIGSTVKVEGDDDPYAFLTVLNMHVHGDKEPIQQIKAYLLKKAEKKAASAAAAAKLSEIFNGSGHVGLLISERVVNMPPQVIAPMLKMLMEELEWAVEDGEPYNFEYYVLVAPMYKETEALDDDEGGQSRTAAPAMAIDAFAHAEDEFIEEFACAKFDYKFSRSPKRAAESRNSFADTGLAASRRCLVIHKSKVAPLIARLEAALAMPTS